jgi:hypothetical protein
VDKTKPETVAAIEHGAVDSIEDWWKKEQGKNDFYCSEGMKTKKIQAAKRKQRYMDGVFESVLQAAGLKNDKQVNSGNSVFIFETGSDFGSQARKGSRSSIHKLVQEFLVKKVGRSINNSFVE